jgi:hypothetical protein
VNHDMLESGGPCECGAWHEKADPIRPAPILAVTLTSIIRHRVAGKPDNSATGYAYNRVSVRRGFNYQFLLFTDYWT